MRRLVLNAGLNFPAAPARSLHRDQADSRGCAAISANTAIATAISVDGVHRNGGAAFLFDVTAGLQIVKLTASDAAAGDHFAWAVATCG